MKYSNIIFLLYFFSSNILLSMQKEVNQLSLLLASKKNSMYDSTKQEKILSKNSTNNFELVPSLPKEVEFVIKKYANFLIWIDEIAHLKDISPVKIGNRELWAMDLLRMHPQDRKVALSYHNKTEFAYTDCEKLRQIISPEMRQGLQVNRLPCNEELYADFAAIPGGRGLLRFGIAPAGGLLIFGMMAIVGLGGSPDKYYDLLATGGGVGAITTVLGSAYAYHRHRLHLKNNLVPTVLEDVEVD